MAIQIQIRRDSAANWTSADPTLAQGEMGYETDTGKIKFGDGSTAWSGLSYFAASTPSYELEDLTDVTLGSPVLNDVLTFNGSVWQASAGGGIFSLNDLSDVVNGSVTEGDVLVAGSPSGVYKNRALVEADISDLGSYIENITAENISDLADVDTTGGSPTLSSGDILRYDGANWVNDEQFNLAMPFFNGTTAQSGVITVTSNGTVVSANVGKSGSPSQGFQVWIGGELMFFAADSVSLTLGTDASPALNYVYITNIAGVATLGQSASGWPTTSDYAPVATVLVQSASRVQTYGALKVHAWTDHVASGDYEHGHMCHLNAWIRSQNATWQSGVAPSVRITTNAGSADNVEFHSTAGVVLQLHDHTYPAVDMATGEEMYVVNDAGSAYTLITDMNSLLTDNQGNSMSAQTFNLVVWGVVNEAEADCKLMVNLPDAAYANNKPDNAIGDTEDTAVYTIPNEFVGVGFLIARITLKHETTASGTWTELNVEDLRGLTPNTAGGGTAGGSGVTDHSLLTNLSADDHTQYLLVDGTRGMSGDLNMGSQDITTVGTVDGVDVSALSDNFTAHAGSPPLGSPSVYHYAKSDINLGDLGDVDLVTGSPAPTVDDVVRYDGANWVHDTLVVVDIEELGNVQGSPIASTGNVLTYYGSPAEWRPAAPAAVPSALNDLTDVNAGSPTHDYVLTYFGSPAEWRPAVAQGGASVLNDLTDVDTTGGSPTLATDHVLKYDGANWVNDSLVIADLGDLGNVLGSPATTGQVLTYYGSPQEWRAATVGTDHGALTGLTDDDHTQYLLVDGTRAMTGGLNMGSQNITSVGTVDGVDVSAHEAAISPHNNWISCNNGADHASAPTSDASSGIAIGSGASGYAFAIAIGKDADTSDGYNIAIGFQANAGSPAGTAAMAIGKDSGASAANAVAIGPSVTNSTATSVRIGNSTTNVLHLKDTGTLTLEGAKAQFVQPNYATGSLPTGVEGGTVYDTDTNSLKIYGGSPVGWVEVKDEDTKLNNQTGTSYTAVLADKHKLITMSNAAANTFTIPANASVAFPIGSTLRVAQLGAGATTIAITTDTLNKNSTFTSVLAGQYSEVVITKITSTSWLMTGDLGLA